MSLPNPALPFFLLPFFLMSGVAMQSAGLYLFLVLWLFPAAHVVPPASRKAILSTASLLAIAYLLPIFVQSLVALNANPLRFCYVDPPRVMSCDLTLKAWMKSPVSSAFLGLGIGWTVFVLSQKKISGTQISPETTSHLTVWSDDELRLKAFARGLLAASVLLFAYGFFQHLTGYNALAKSKILEDEHRMANGAYRIFGFYGHPLSMAGAALVWSGVALYGVWACFRKTTERFGLNLLGWLCVAALQSGLVYMSGGRTALLVVVVLWSALVFSIFSVVLSKRVFTTNNKSITRPITLTVFFGVLPAAVLFALFHFRATLETLAQQLFTRGLGGGSLGQGPLGDRELFWQVYLAMWRDSPWLGQGYFAVEHGLRTHFYVHEGFASLNDKFNAHNIFLELLGTTGLVGFFAYLIICVLLWINMKVLAGKSRPRQFVVGALAVAFLANAMHGLTQNTFFDSALTSCYLALIGFLVVPPLKSSWSKT